MLAVARLLHPPISSQALVRHVRVIAPWLLVIGYLPSLTFLGHIPLDFNIPGTSLYIGMPELGAPLHHDFAAASGGDQGYDHVHEEHCHTNMGSCSDAPLTASASFGLMGWVISLLGAATAAFALTGHWWQPHFSLFARPLTPPPRSPRVGI